MFNSDGFCSYKYFFLDVARSRTTACNPETQSMLQQKSSDSEVTDKR